MPQQQPWQAAPAIARGCCCLMTGYKIFNLRPLRPPRHVPGCIIAIAAHSESGGIRFRRGRGRGGLPSRHGHGWWARRPRRRASRRRRGCQYRYPTAASLGSDPSQPAVEFQVRRTRNRDSVNAPQCRTAACQPESPWHRHDHGHGHGTVTGLGSLRRRTWSAPPGPGLQVGRHGPSPSR